MKGYLDRIEENKLAVILVEELNQEFIISLAELPDGSNPKTWFDVVIDSDKITSININNEMTTSEQKKVDEMVTKLRAKSKGSKFKRR